MIVVAVLMVFPTSFRVTLRAELRAGRRLIVYDILRVESTPSNTDAIVNSPPLNSPREREGEIEREGGTGVRCLAGSQPDRHQAPGPWKNSAWTKQKTEYLSQPSGAGKLEIRFLAVPGEYPVVINRRLVVILP